MPSLATFAPLVGSTFVLRPPSGRPVSVVLKVAEPLPRQSALRGEAFTAIFHGPKSPLIAQSVMSISHESVGPFRLFVVPVGLSSSYHAYQVVVEP